jgi:uncharacterized coiled-coil protein SlyX
VLYYFNMANYTFELTGDYKSKLAAMADGDNVIKIDPVSATKAEFACYLMHQMSENAKQITTVNESVKTLSETVTTLLNTVTTLNGKVTDLETAATAKDVEIKELQDRLRETERKLDTQERDMNHLMKRADQCDKANLEMERHSRSSNLRIGGIDENPNEDCKAVTLAVLTKLDVGNVDIENVHRVGSKEEGKTRMMIVRFVRRTERREVLVKRKEFFEKNFPLYEDLPKADLVIKKKYKKEIANHYLKKDKCYFARGAWFVNNIKKYW